MKNTLIWIAKAALAGLVATGVLCCFDLVYDNMPIHHDSDTGATDYVWDKSTIVLRFTEGSAFFWTDSNGFNNDESLVEASKDILLMGSSQIEAFEVMSDENTGALLNDYYEDLNTYNIGTSGHSFLVCAKNLEAALSEYAPSSYVCIETSSLSFTGSNIERYLGEDAPHLSSSDKGVLYYLQRIPYFRNVYHQIQYGFLGISAAASDDDDIAVDSDNSEEIDATAYDALFSHIATTCESHGVTPIVFYHPYVSLQEDGSLLCDIDEEDLATFAAYCEKYGIVFVDVTDYFLQMYEEEHVVPYGFLNTSLCTGHMNKYGHRAVATALEDCIDALESGAN